MNNSHFNASLLINNDNINMTQFNSNNSNFMLNYAQNNASYMAHPYLDRSKNYEFFNYQQQSTLDQNWVNNWLSQKKFSEKVKKYNHNPMTVSDAQNALRTCLTILTKLKEAEADLKGNISNFSNLTWEQKLMEIDKQKALLLNSLSSFDNTSMMSALQKRIKKCKYRRTAQKLKKVERRTVLREVYQKRQKIDNSINQWLEEQKEQTEKVKREEYMKRDADCILAEVTKKKADARRQLTLLSSLIKLRSVRQVAAESRGEKVSAEDSSTFSTITERLKNMWQKALEKYQVEEQGLKEMLKNKSTREEIKEDKHKTVMVEWDEALFGKTYVPSNAFLILTCAERDLETFIALRKSWDTFLTSQNNCVGTSIPIGWILPPHTPSAEWDKYLEDKCEK